MGTRRSTLRQAARAMGLMALLSLGATTARAQPAPPTPASAERLVPLEVRVNQSAAGNWVLLELGGALHAPPEAFDEWRVNRPAVPPLRRHQQDWFPLSAVPGFEARFHPADQSVDLSFAPQAFAATHLTRITSKRLQLSPVEPALFLNYDASATRFSFAGTPAQQDLGLLAEWGLATDAGVLTSSHAGRNLATRGFDAPPSWQRLETSFTRDFPDTRTSLRLGDLSTRAVAIGRPVFFGGIQVSRNFGLQPGFISRPIPTLAGSSSAPSTVELYINDVLRQTSQVPAGPFTLDNQALPDSAGQVRMVVRDILGRESVVEHSFFSSNAMLAPGLSDWSVEAGALRRNLGLPNAGYSERFGAGLYRRGLSPLLTAEWRAAVSRAQQEASVALSRALEPWPVLLQAGLAGSHSSLGHGAAWLLSAEYGGLGSGWLLRSEGNTAVHRGLGQSLESPVTRRQTTLSYRFAGAAWGSLSMSAAHTVAGDGSVYRAATWGYSVRVGERSSFNLGVTRLIGASAGTRVLAQLFVPLGARSTLTTSAARTRHGRLDSTSDTYLAASGSEPGGWAWRLLAGERSSAGQAEAGLYHEGRHGNLALDASRTRLQRNLRLGAQGSLVLADAQLFATRRSGQGMALVEVPGQGDVGVGLLGQFETTTRASGHALVTQLLPNQPNAIRLNASDLPIGAELDSIEMTAVPPARSVVKLRFPVRTGRAALVRVLLDDGAPAPAGAEVGIVGDAQVFYMARRGEVFVTGLSDAATLTLRWKQSACTLAITLPPDTGNDITRVGPLVCAGVSR